MKSEFYPYVEIINKRFTKKKFDYHTYSRYINTLRRWEWQLEFVRLRQE